MILAVRNLEDALEEPLNTPEGRRDLRAARRRVVEVCKALALETQEAALAMEALAFEEAVVSPEAVGFDEDVVLEGAVPFDEAVVLEKAVAFDGAVGGAVALDDEDVVWEEAVALHEAFVLEEAVAFDKDVGGAVASEEAVAFEGAGGGAVAFEEAVAVSAGGARRRPSEAVSAEGVAAGSTRRRLLVPTVQKPFGWPWPLKRPWSWKPRQPAVLPPGWPIGAPLPKKRPRRER